MTDGDAPRVVRVLPDVPAIDKTFDYLVPDAVGDQVRVGTMVRVELHRRRVGGWVVADHVEPPEGVRLRPLAKVTGWGPPADLIELAEWAAWRWAGRTASFLGTASPLRAVPGLPRGAAHPAAAATVATVAADAALIDEAFGRGPAGALLRLPPAADLYPVVAAAAAKGAALILAPSVAQARHLGLRLRRAGVPVALLPNEWAVARAGGSVVVGSRAAAWAPVPDLAAVVVLDEHDEVYQEERAPTWHARDVAIERARRAGVPCILVSPTPSLEALRWAEGDGAAGDAAEAAGAAAGRARHRDDDATRSTARSRLITVSRVVERDGWSIVDVIDRHDEEPGRAGLYSERLVKVLRSDARVVCVLNRKGRSRLLACVTCGVVTRCEHCDASVLLSGEGRLLCQRCATERPSVCQACGGTALKNLRAGVTRVREELEALANAPVAELGADPGDEPGDARIVIGTEAVLHQRLDASVVAFLDFDQELLAPRYRAAEEAMALLVRAVRLLARTRAEQADAGRGRAALGRVLIQTRMPQHEVIQAALHADPARVAAAEQDRRELLLFPPVRAMAVLSGTAAADHADRLRATGGAEILGPSDGRFLVRAPDHQTLCDVLAATARPPGRLRIEVDPLRL